MRCDACPHDCKTVGGEWKRKGTGSVLMIVAQNPGKMEANVGRPMVGPSGGLARQAVAFWEGPIYVTNAIKCRPLDTKLSLVEVEACLPTLEMELAGVRPAVILSLGTYAESALVRLRDKGLLEGITVVQHSHPAMTLGKGSGVRQGAWVQSCHAALLKVLNTPPPIEIKPLVADLPVLLGSDTEYFTRPVWRGADIWALSDGKDVWAEHSPSEKGRKALLLGRTVVFHHSVNELLALKGMGVSLPDDIHDTMVLAVLDDAEGPRDLKVLAATKLGYVYDDPRVKQMAFDDRTTTYCGHDARASCLLYQKVYQQVAKTGLYTSLYKPVIPILADMSFRGLRVDKVKAKTKADEIEVRLREVDAELATFQDIPWGHDEAVEKYMVEKGYPLSKMTVGGARYSVDKESLLPLSRSGVREATLVLERRALGKILGTYLKKIINAPDDFLRTILNPVGAETGRISSGGEKQLGMTNLQNVPKHLRELFLPPEGMVWVGADASQHEVRVLAWLAERGLAKRPLSSAVCGSTDFYRYIGEAYLRRPPTEEERDAFKTVVLAGQYLARPGTLQKHLEMDGIFMEKDAIEAMMEFVDGQFPTIRQWHERLFAEARETGQITTPLGRRRRVFVGPGGALAPETRRVIVNSPVQGTASDFVLFGLLRAHQAGLLMLLTVHDSLDAAAYPDQVKEVAEVLRRSIVEEPLLEDSPGMLSVKVKAGPSWGELTPIAA